MVDKISLSLNKLILDNIFNEKPKDNKSKLVFLVNNNDLLENWFLLKLMLF